MIDIQHSNERNFCGAITPKEKDKIMKAILDMAAHERKTFCFTPNDVPNLRINGKQFEMVIVYRQLCPCFQRGKCKHYPHNQKQGSQICDMECDRISYLKKQLACISADK